MIKSVRFHDFKALRDVEVELDRLTVIVGPNSSGKTSILQGIDVVNGIYWKSPAEQFQGPYDPNYLLSRNAQEDFSVTLKGHLSLGSEPSSDDIAMSGRSIPGYGTKRTEGQLAGWAFDISIVLEDKRYSIQDIAQPLFKRLPDIAFPLLRHISAIMLRLEFSKLAAAHYTLTPNPVVMPDGSGLASVLAEMALNRPGEFQKLQEGLRSIVPLVESVRLSFIPVQMTEWQTVTVNEKPVPFPTDKTYTGQQIVFDMKGAPNIPAHSVSEGTLLSLGLLTVLHGKHKPALVLLDDLDRGLHPAALKQLVEQLRKLLEQNPDLQILATSHSPYLLDHFEAHEIRLTSLREDGSVACAKLTDHPEFEKWKDLMAPGEFWSSVGEKWVVDKERTGNS